MLAEAARVGTDEVVPSLPAEPRGVPPATALANPPPALAAQTSTATAKIRLMRLMNSRVSVGQTKTRSPAPDLDSHPVHRPSKRETRRP
jgi:hypothetical protein